MDGFRRRGAPETPASSPTASAAARAGSRCSSSPPSGSRCSSPPHPVRAHQPGARSSRRVTTSARRSGSRWATPSRWMPPVSGRTPPPRRRTSRPPSRGSPTTRWCTTSSPRGLEQFSGGGWGTRDVCQGPVGLLTALGRQDEVRDVLLRVLRAPRTRAATGRRPSTSCRRCPSRASRTPTATCVFWPLLAIGELPAHDRRRDAARRAGRLRRRRRADRARAGRWSTCARAVARIDGAARSRDRAAGIRPRRLERLAPAGRPAPGGRLVSTWTAVLQIAGAATRSPTGSDRRRARGHRAWPARADDARGAHPRGARASAARSTAVLPGYLLHPRRRAPSSRWCTRATSAPVCATASSRGSTRSPPTC